jgi:surface carbohydrate biosynthesis protein (TIGR04326 family)
MEILDISNLSLKNIKILNSISNNIKRDFNALTEELLNSTDKSIDWLVNSTTSRNPYWSNLYLNICYLVLIKQLLKENRAIGKVIVPNVELKKVLIDYLKRNKISIKVISNQSLRKNIKNKTRPLYNFLVNIYRFILMWMSRNKRRKESIPTDHEITLIDTFFLSSMFKNGKYSDRYYNGLLEYLTDDERRRIYFVPSILIKTGFKKIMRIAEKSGEKFLFKEDYLKLSDYFFALVSPFRIRRINFSKFKFKDFNIGPVLQSDFRCHIFASALSILNHRFFRRLKENKIRLGLVVDWFENQPIDHGFNKGIKDFYPKTYSIGYQGYIISTDFNFYIQPTKYETENGIIPEAIAVVGKGLKKQIKRFDSTLNVITAPAFRFKSVWDLVEAHKTSNKKIVLVALPIAIKESIEILKLVINAIKIGKYDDVEFQIKSHPVLDTNKLKSKFGNLPNNFEFIEGNFKDCVVKAKIMIGNTSSTCLETLAIGIPVIIIGSQSGLTQNPIPENVNKDIWRICYTPEELSNAINHFLSISEEERDILKKIGEEIRAMYFEPVTRESVRKFLRLQ